VEQIVDEHLAGILIQFIPCQTAYGRKRMEAILGVCHALSATSLRVTGERAQCLTLPDRRELADKLDNLFIRQR
jgi:hypothetical protein